MDKQVFVESGRNLFTQSRLRAFRKCPRYHHLRYGIGLVPSEVKKALRMGSAFHLGQEKMGQIPEGLEGDEYWQRIDECILAALVDYNEPPPAYVEAEEWAIEREIVGRLLKGYAWRWQNEIVTVEMTERQFKQPVMDIETGEPVYKMFHSAGGPPSRVPLYRAGMIDKVCKLPDGRVVVVEHKTTGDSVKPGSDYWKQARMSPQVSFYYQAAMDDPDMPAPAAILYDVIRKPAIGPKLLSVSETRAFLGLAYRKGKKTVVPPDASQRYQYYGESFDVDIFGTVDNEEPDNTSIERVVVDGALAEWGKSGKNSVLRETPTMFGARLLEDMFSRSEMYFAREEITRLQDDLDEFAADVHQTVDMVMYCERTGRWPKNADSCIYPYRCEYFNICSNNIQVTVEGEVPQGYSRLDYVHPELLEDQ
jgi:hypothetical protein